MGWLQVHVQQNDTGAVCLLDDNRDTERSLRLRHHQVTCLSDNLALTLMFSSFGGIQNVPAFEQQFGEPIGENGEYKLSPSRASFMSSIGFAGKFFGALVTIPLQLSLATLTTLSAWLYLH